MSEHRLIRVVVLLALAGVYFAASKFGFTMAFEAEQVTLVWPPTGIALTAILLFGHRMWPGIMLGAFLANVTTNEPVITAGGIAIGNTLEAVTGAWMLRRFAGFHNNLGHLKDVLGLVFFSAILSTMISATIGVTSLCLGGVQPWVAYKSLWFTWWLGDAAGALIFAPALLVWCSRPRVAWHPRRFAEGIFLGAILVFICTGIFTEPHVMGIRGSAFIYLIFPFIIFAALRFGQHGTVLVTLAASAIATWATVHGFGPFTAGTVDQNLVLLQIFMGVVVATGLLLGAAISERNESGKAQAHMAAMIASSEDAIVGRDLNGIINFWNAAAERLFGYSAAEAMGKSIMMFIPSVLQDEERCILERLYRGERIEHYETVRVAKNGRKIDVSLTASPIRDAMGRIIGVSKVARDISERKWAAEILRESEERFRLMADTAPVLIWMAGTDKKCAYFNKPWLDFTGRSMEQEVDDGWAEGIHPDDLASCFETYVNSFDARRPFEMEYRLRHHSGEYRWIVDYGTPRFTSQGEFTGYIGSCIDITRRKDAEEAIKESDRRKDEFLATLAHELRNPLAPLKGALHLLKQPKIEATRRNEALDIMKNQLQQMVRLVDDLLDVSRISHGKIELRKKRLTFAEALRMALETTTPLIEANRHTLSITVPKETLWLDADIIRLSQIFSNLFGNAAKYTKPGGHITLEAMVEDRTLVVKVCDTGIGIPPDMLPRIFDMFTQVDSSVERAHGGLGIGLTLVKKLVELHGGSVVARSDGLDQGSEFTVRLPLASAPARQSVAPSQPAMLPAQQHKRRVLVVDDNQNLAKTLGWMVESIGHEAKVIYDGMQVLEVAQSYRPDVILLDIGLAGTSGYELGKALRRCANLKHCILVAHTGWGQPEHRRRSKEAGFDYHLVKPVELETLAELFATLPAAA
jgi:PAS domain S-box-containing protein